MTLIKYASLATIAICIMTLVTFMITIGAWEPDFWQSSIVDYDDGYWGEDIIIIYTDGTTESVKQISDNYWSSMSIQNDGSKPISAVQYCINVMIPVSDVFDPCEYRCDVSVVQDSIEFYQTSYTTTGFVSVEANEWVRIVTVALDIQSVSGEFADGIYHIYFENTGTIEGITVPDGLSLDVAVEDDVVTFLI